MERAAKQESPLRHELCGKKGVIDPKFTKIVTHSRAERGLRLSETFEVL